jgi:hypothetical protein
MEEFKAKTLWSTDVESFWVIVLEKLLQFYFKVIFLLRFLFAERFCYAILFVGL